MWRNLMIFLVALLASACASTPERPAGGVPAGDTSYLEARVAHLVGSLRDDLKLPSVTVLVTSRDKTLYEQAFGFADRAAGRESTLETPYQWGSNSKLFVLLALLQLEATGEVELDKPLATYISNFSIRPPAPGLPGSADWSPDDITLRAMLAHHSGLPNDLLVRRFSEDPLPLEEFPEHVAKLRAQHPAGLVHSYSNLAYNLLGLVIQNVSGQPFERYVNTHILEPTQMSASSFVWTDALKRNVALSYDFDESPMPHEKISDIPAGGLIASTRDMGRFARAMLSRGRVEDGLLVTREAFDASISRQNAHVALDFDLQQGLAWFLDRRPVEVYGHTIEHGGAIQGHHSAFLLSLDWDLGVAIVTNGQKGAGAVQALAAEVLQLARECQTGQPPSEPQMSSHAKRIKAESSALARWQGDYATIAGALRVTQRGSSLRTNLLGRDLRLNLLDDGTMGLSARLLGLFNVRPGPLRDMRLSLVEAAGLDVVVTETPGGKAYVGVRYEPTRAPPTWQQRVGVYRSVSPDHGPIPGFRFYLTEEEELRVVVFGPQVKGLPETALRPVDDLHAVGVGFGRGQGLEFRFDEHDDLHFLGARFERKDAMAD